MGTLDRLKQSLGFDSQISRLISNNDPGMDSIAEVYQALYSLHQENLQVLLDLESRMDSISSGTSGTSGASGDLGTSGTSGFDGTSGTSGIKGTSGTSGFDGTSGTSGISGTSGTSGFTGTSGTSGTSSTLAFSPMNISDCDLAPTAATTQYYYLTIAEATMTISKAKLWGYSGSDNVLFGIYRGTLSSHTLIGTGSSVCGVGPNIINITPVSGQNLNVQAGENLVVGYYPDGISWRTIYDAGINDLTFGITNTSNISSMPSTISGTSTAVRFALTLY